MRTLTNQDGGAVAQYDYYAFGQVRAASSSSDEWRFTGEQWDAGAGLYFLRARYYEPGVGRFVSADPFWGYAQLPQTQNRYVYVTNNPVNLVDPTGLDEHDYYVFVQGVWDQSLEPVQGREVKAYPGGVSPWLEYLRMSLPAEYQNDNAKWEVWKNEHVLLVAYEGIPAAKAASDLFERVKRRQTGIVERKSDLKNYGFNDRQGKIRLIGHSFGGVVAMEFVLRYAGCIDADMLGRLQVESIATIDSPLKGVAPPANFERHRKEQTGVDEFGNPIYIEIDRIEEFARLHPEISLLTVSNRADMPDVIGHDPIPGRESGYMPGYKYVMDRYGNEVSTLTGAPRYYNDYGFCAFCQKDIRDRVEKSGRSLEAYAQIHRRVMEEDTLVRWWVNRHGGLY